MAINARYVHTNLIARDWRRMAAFYEQVFGCRPVPPERHLTEAWVAQASGVPGAAIHGVHLRLPGCGGDGKPSDGAAERGGGPAGGAVSAAGRDGVPASGADDAAERGGDGPTLEIFQYNLLKEGEAPAINRPGLAHLAFAVDDVPAALDAVRAAGGGQLGELVRVEVPGVGRLVFVYATDPEGNLIELQRWERSLQTLMGP